MIHHIAEVIEHHLGDAAGTLFFLMGAMTIVEIVDSNGGFNFVRDTMKTRSKRKLMWRMAFMTFFLSAILDNLTTSIVMIMVLRKLVQNRNDRLTIEEGVWSVTVGRDDEADVGIMVQFLEAKSCLSNHRSEVATHGIQLPGAHLHLADIHHLVHQCQQLLCIAVDET